MNQEIVTGQGTEGLVDPVLGCTQAPQPRRGIPLPVRMQGSGYRDCCQCALPFVDMGGTQARFQRRIRLTPQATFPVSPCRAEKSAALGRVPRRCGRRIRAPAPLRGLQRARTWHTPCLMTA